MYFTNIYLFGWQNSQIHTANSIPREVQENQDLRQQINMACMLLISFIAEHNLPFVIAEHMTELCKKMFPDSAIADALHMKRTKCTDVTKKIGSVISENLVKDLRQCKFSIILDE